jgi:hypothetical protein
MKRRYKEESKKSNFSYNKIFTWNSKYETVNVQRNIASLSLGNENTGDLYHIKIENVALYISCTPQYGMSFDYIPKIIYLRIENSIDSSKNYISEDRNHFDGILLLENKTSFSFNGDIEDTYIYKLQDEVCTSTSMIKNLDISFWIYDNRSSSTNQINTLVLTSSEMNLLNLTAPSKLYGFDLFEFNDSSNSSLNIEGKNVISGFTNNICICGNVKINNI